MKHLFALLLLSLSFAPLAVRADMVPDNTHPVDNCVSIDASQKYEGNYFIYADYKFPGSTYLSSNPIACGFAGEGQLFLVTAELSKGETVAEPNLDPLKTEARDSETYGNWPKDPRNAQYIVWSDLNITFDAFVSDIDRTVRTYTQIYVDSVENGKVTAHIADRLAFDKDGNIIVPPGAKQLVGQETGTAFVPTDDSASLRSIVATYKIPPTTSPFALMWIVIVCMGACILAIGIKAWKK